MTEFPTEREQALEAIEGFRLWMKWDLPEDDPLPPVATEPAGRCDDCGEGARVRRRIGQFVCCLACASLRMKAGFKAAVRLPSDDKQAARF